MGIRGLRPKLRGGYMDIRQDTRIVIGIQGFRPKLGGGYMDIRQNIRIQR